MGRFSKKGGLRDPGDVSRVHEGIMGNPSLGESGEIQTLDTVAAGSLAKCWG